MVHPQMTPLSSLSPEIDEVRGSPPTNLTHLYMGIVILISSPSISRLEAPNQDKTWCTGTQLDPHSGLGASQPHSSRIIPQAAKNKQNRNSATDDASFFVSRVSRGDNASCILLSLQSMGTYETQPSLIFGWIALIHVQWNLNLL